MTTETLRPGRPARPAAQGGVPRTRAERAGQASVDRSWRQTIPRRRRGGDIRAVMASILAVLAIVGAVTAILILTAQSTTATLEGEIGALNGRTDAARREVAALQAGAARLTSQNLSARTEVRRLGRGIAALRRTVAGLQSTAGTAQEQANAVRACVPQLQQELAGLSLSTHSVKGRLAGVALTDSAGLTPGCRVVLSGL
jgi:cell division protein FtsB